MDTDSPFPKRRSLRIRDYDYTSPGAYFITVTAHRSHGAFGAMELESLRLSREGEIVVRCWQEIPRHFPTVDLGDFVVMPKHVHGLIFLVRARHAVPEQERMEAFGRPVSGSVPTIIRSFKSAASRRINEMRGTPGCPVWDRGFNEHVVRGESELRRICECILTTFARLAIRHSGSG